MQRFDLADEEHRAYQVVETLKEETKLSASEILAIRMHTTFYFGFIRHLIEKAEKRQ